MSNELENVVKKMVKATKLPKGFEFEVGEVDIDTYNKIMAIPKNLVFKGNLDLSNCKTLTELPENLKVTGNLNLENCLGLTQLPLNLEVKKLINISGCKGIEDLPADIQVLAVLMNFKTGFLKKDDSPTEPGTYTFTIGGPTIRYDNNNVIKRMGFKYQEVLVQIEF